MTRKGTSPADASKAARILRNPKSTPARKSVAGSDLAEAAEKQGQIANAEPVAAGLAVVALAHPFRQRAQAAIDRLLSQRQLRAR